VTETKVIVSDIQAPYHDRKKVKAVVNYIIATQPDEVVFIGDQLDMPQPSRWSKDTRAEFEGSVYQDAENFCTEVLEPLRRGYKRKIGMHEGNHDERARVYLEKYAPALSGTDVFDMASLLRFSDFDIEELPTFYDIAPGWVSTHGHKGGIRLSQIAGNTALNAAKKLGKSVVMGHTHRQGIGSATTGIPPKTTTVTGMEVGNLMDMKQAGYLKEGPGNWQSGFGILNIDGKHVQPQVVPMSAGRFIVNGVTWEV